MKLQELQALVEKTIKDKGIKRPNKTTRFNIVMSLIKKGA